MTEVPPAYRRLLEQYRDIDAIDATISLMNWDRQVLMPPAATDARSAHVARLARMRHAILTSDAFRRSVEEVERESEPGSIAAAAARALRRDLKTQGSLPSELVMRKARVSSDAYEVWKGAKANNDYPAMRPYLEQLYDINGETAECIGYKDHIYDALIDLFEEGATYADARAMFDAIKGPTVELLKDIRERGSAVDDSVLAKEFDRPKLREFAQHAASTVGFSFDAGRLDICNNAFCTHLANNDIRMTTRPSDHFKGIVSSSLHEMGHGLYEQNSPPEFEGTPLAGGISLAVHESQSRLWENIVGRSLGFWSKLLPDLQARFPEFSAMDAEGMYRAMNKVEPTFVRVGSDEVSYNLHILVRFELETEILTGKTSFADLPEAWNAKYTEYLGIRPPTDTLGCLQDVHWSRGMVGYFPTYTMGNLISYQMWACLERDLGDALNRGDFGAILGWLKEKVYSQGKLFIPRELVTRVTGRPMEPADILAGLRAKYGKIYGV
jgi:carboxypeptidase Taq